MRWSNLGWLWLSAGVLLVDQLTKWAASHGLEYARPVSVLPSFNLTLLHNTGAAFSFLSDAGGWQRWFFVLISIAVSALIVVWIARLRVGERWTGAGLALVLGGAIGNLVDRLSYGHVVDFIDLYWGESHWPAFNIADSAITVGVVILLITSLADARGRSEEKADD